jgi:hypothetical protein
VTGDQVEVAPELLVDQRIHLVRASDLDHKGFVGSLLVLGCHDEVGRMRDENLNVVGTVAKVLDTLEQDLTLHSCVRLLPILL